jgi:hypothetical protein
MTPKIWVDFQKRNGTEVYLTTLGTKNDLERQRIELIDGLNLFLYQDDPVEHGRDGFLYATAVVRWEERKLDRRNRHCETYDSRLRRDSV